MQNPIRFIDFLGLSPTTWNENTTGLVSLRGFVEARGGTVSWNYTTNDRVTVNFGSAGSRTYFVDGDEGAFIKNGIMMIDASVLI